MNTHLRNSFGNRLVIAKVAVLRSINPRLNPRLRAPIVQSLEPEVKDLG